MMSIYITCKTKYICLCCKYRVILCTMEKLNKCEYNNFNDTPCKDKYNIGETARKNKTMKAYTPL